MENNLVQTVLLNVFNKLTSNSIEFFDVFGYKTAEITVDNLPTFGIGLYEEDPSIKIFILNDQFKSNNDRYNRFSEIAHISRRVIVSANKKTVWNVEFTDEAVLTEAIGNFSVISKNIQAILYVMQAIEIEEHFLLKET